MQYSNGNGQLTAMLTRKLTDPAPLQLMAGVFVRLLEPQADWLNGRRHLAGHKEVIELLVKRRANLKATTGKNQTPEGIAKNVTTKQLLRALAAAQPHQNAGADTGQVSAPANGSSDSAQVSTAQPALSAQNTGPAADCLPSATDAKSMGAPSLESIPLAVSETGQEPCPAYIGPMLPPAAHLASAHPASAIGAGQEASLGQLGPIGPIPSSEASMSKTERVQDGNEAQAQVGPMIPGADEPTDPKDSSEPSAVSPLVHAAGAEPPQPQPQLPSSKAAGHVRRKREEIEVEGSDTLLGASAKKAKVSLAHLGDDEEDML